MPRSIILLWIISSYLCFKKKTRSCVFPCVGCDLPKWKPSPLLDYLKRKWSQPFYSATARIGRRHDTLHNSPPAYAAAYLGMHLAYSSHRWRYTPLPFLLFPIKSFLCVVAIVSFVGLFWFYRRVKSTLSSHPVSPNFLGMHSKTKVI